MSTVLDLSPITQLTREQFHQLCRANRDVPLERSPKGELIIVSPVGGESGNREANLIGDVIIWNRQSLLGVVFSSSTIFSLPGQGDRSPDVAWVRRDRWEALTSQERESFPPICPDFVIELRSKSDQLKPLQEKMQEYLESGLRLGWLINPQDQQMKICCSDQPVRRGVIVFALNKVYVYTQERQAAYTSNMSYCLNNGNLYEYSTEKD